ncbi:tetratricopeptide repeat protein [Primorskyibacter sp. S87]|uniref:tetratricopeptide repeat protein n=1 Tax=Primorskyibacter sp. S87 TaxID=3415126 RepID=UPI003C7D35CD
MRFLLSLVFAAALVVPETGFSAGDNLPKPPKPTNTTKTCKGNRVWDDNKGRCVRPKKSSLNDDQLYGAVRELAYAGRYEDAQSVLSAMPDQADDRVLTYWGFTHRKLGNLELANVFYERAISRNPDNLLARSYMGQGFVAEGRTEDAIAQWREIRARGGEGSWPEQSLREAIRSGFTYGY